MNDEESWNQAGSLRVLAVSGEECAQKRLIRYGCNTPDESYVAARARWARWTVGLGNLAEITTKGKTPP
jgi:hypothetical protein